MIKNILIVTGIFPPEIGGPATYSDTLLRELPKRGFSVQVVTYGKPDAKIVIGVSRIWPKGIRHLIFFIKVLQSGLGCDLILAADASFGAGYLAGLAAWILRKKFVVRITGDYAWEQGVARFGVTDLLDDFQPLAHGGKYSLTVRALARFQATTLSMAGVVVAPSEYLKKIAMQWGIVADKIKVIYNGVPGAQVAEFKETLRNELGFAGKVVISVGRLVPWKGFGMLIDAFGELIGEIPGAQLLIVGDGPDRLFLAAKIRDLKLEASVKLLGRLPHTELMKYIKAADVFALNTAYEGFSHQIVEAMGLGTPVMTTVAGGNLELVTNEENGLIFAFNDKEKMEEALLRLLRDDALRLRIGANGVSTAARFTDERMVGELSNLVSSL